MCVYIERDNVVYWKETKGKINNAQQISSTTGMKSGSCIYTHMSTQHGKTVLYTSRHRPV